jgi:hypothetical protein
MVNKLPNLWYSVIAVQNKELSQGDRYGNGTKEESRLNSMSMLMCPWRHQGSELADGADLTGAATRRNS